MDEETIRRAQRWLTAVSVAAAVVWGVLIADIFDSPQDVITWVAAVASLVALAGATQVKKMLRPREDASATGHQHEDLDQTA